MHLITRSTDQPQPTLKTIRALSLAIRPPYPHHPPWEPSSYHPATGRLIHWEFPRLCRGGSRSLTFPGVCPGFPTDGTLMRALHKQTPGRKVAPVPPGVTAWGWRVSK
jgi:hypothetical protein